MRRIHVAAGGALTLQLTMERGGSIAGTVHFADASGVVRASQARVVEVQGRESHDGVDIEVPVKGLHTIAGKVVTREGGVVDQGIVRVCPTGEPEVLRAGPLGVHGEFRFEGVIDDEYTVSMEFEGATEFWSHGGQDRGACERARRVLRR